MVSNLDIDLAESGSWHLVVNPHEGMKPDEDMSMCCSVCDLLQRAMIGEARAHFACPATWAASPVLYCPKAGHKSTSHAKGSLYPCQRSVTGAPCVVSCMAATPSQHSESTAMEHTCMHAMHFAPFLQASASVLHRQTTRGRAMSEGPCSLATSATYICYCTAATLGQHRERTAM